LELVKIANDRKEHRAPSVSTIYRWRRKYIVAMNDVRSLIAGFDSQGGRGKSRLDPIIEGIIDDAIESITLSQRRASGYEVYQAVRLEVERANLTKEQGRKLTPPSLRTIQRRVAQVSALDLEIAQTSPEFATRKFKTHRVSRDVSRILELVEIDHTPADIIVVNEAREPLARPMMTIILDRRSRCVLGFHLSLSGHGVPAVFEALRHALLPKHYLTLKYADLGISWVCYGWFEKALMDNGSEFHAEAVADALLSLGIATEFAPSHEPNAKPYVERFNRRINYELIHKLPGSTLDHHHKRLGFDPYKEAALTLEELDRACHVWICNNYHKRPHKGLSGKSPMEVWEAEAKINPPLLKMNKEDIDVEFCEVTTSQVQHYGIDLNTFQYDSSQLQNLRACLPRKTKVTVKWARYDVGHIWVWDSISQEFLRVSNRDPSYCGVTLEQAKAFKGRNASPDAKADLHPARADETVREMVEDAVNATTQAQRRKGGRLGNRTSRGAREPFGEPSQTDDNRGGGLGRSTQAYSSTCSGEELQDVEVELPIEHEEDSREY
jgi:putative transposase